MATICPTVTAYDAHEYRAQMEQIEAFAKRVHIDLMDGVFSPNKSPELEQIWWPETLIADLHLMYHHPMDSLEQIIKLHPNLVVIHYEAEGDHLKFSHQLRTHDIKSGLALLQNTAVDDVMDILSDFDHVMVYSGHLGEHGGLADLNLLDKVRQIRQEFPNIEISWDGGINGQNAPQLVEAGVNVLNVGGFIQQSDDPPRAYATLKTVIES